MAAIVAGVSSPASLQAAEEGLAWHRPIRLNPVLAPVARARPCRASGAACAARHALSGLCPEACDAHAGAPTRHARMTATAAQAAGLRRCDRQGDVPPPRRERRVHPCRVPAEPNGAAQLVGGAAEPRLAATLACDHLCNPPVQRIMPIDVGAHGRADAALRDAGVRGDHPAGRLQNACLQPLPEQAQKGPVLEAPPQPLPQPGMVHVVEDAVTIGLHHRPLPPVWPVHGQVADRLPGPARGAVPIPARQTLRRSNRVQESGVGGRKERVCDARHASRPFLAVALRHGVPTKPRRPVPLLLQPLHHGRDLGLQGLCRPLPRPALHPTGRVLMPVAPALPQKRAVQAAVAGSNPLRLGGFRLVG
jgi:hypothetical protein